MIDFEINLLVALRAFCVLALIIFFELGFSLSQSFFNVLRELISAHRTGDSDV
jgi:hypothetical protein